MLLVHGGLRWCVCVGGGGGLVKYGLVCTSEVSHTSEVSQPSLAKAA
jgi:hypothetical protein